MTLKAVLQDAEQKMKAAVEAIQRECAGIRGGRAASSLVDHLRVEYYGNQLPLAKIATISNPEARLLVVKPWDASALGAVEKAILQANLGLTPQNDGKVVRVEVPPLSHERRAELVKAIRKIAEVGRVSIRNARRESNEALKALEQADHIGEDQRFSGQEQIQTLTDRYVRQLDELVERKEAELNG